MLLALEDIKPDSRVGERQSLEGLRDRAVLPLNPATSTTNVSPSQQPTEPPRVQYLPLRASSDDIARKRPSGEKLGSWYAPSEMYSFRSTSWGRTPRWAPTPPRYRPYWCP